MCSKKPHGLSIKLDSVQVKINQFHSSLDSNTNLSGNARCQRDSEAKEKPTKKDQFGTSLAYLVREKTGLILQQSENRSGAKWLNRTFACGNIPIKSDQPIEFYKGVKGAHSFKGLAACGKWWVCPVCAAKKSFKDYERLMGAIDRLNKEGEHTYLFITNTAPHTFEDPIYKTANTINNGIKAINQDKKYRALKKELGYVGFFRVAEITMGGKELKENPNAYPTIKNGFHYHTHQLFVFKGAMSETDLNTFKSQYIAKYKTKVNHPNLQIDIKRASGATEVASYISKEMNFSFTKDSNIFNVIAKLKFKDHYIVERLQNETRRLKKTVTMGLGINQANENDLKDDEVLNLIAAIDPKLWPLILRHNLKVKLANSLINHGVKNTFKWLKQYFYSYDIEVNEINNYLFVSNKKNHLKQSINRFKKDAEITTESYRKLRELKASGAKKRTVKQHKLTIFEEHEINLPGHHNIGAIRSANEKRFFSPGGD